MGGYAIWPSYRTARMAAINAPGMRAEGCLCWVYLDDFLILAPMRIRAKTATAKLVSLLRDLGLTVNFTKSQLEPTQKIVYLGFLINLVDGRRLLIPPLKQQSHRAENFLMLGNKYLIVCMQKRI